MNSKQTKIYEILDIVVGCCCVEVNGQQCITAEDVLSPNRSESVIMTRCMFATHLRYMGYSVTTIAHILQRGEKAVENMLNQAQIFRNQSYAYRLAEAESTLKLKQIMSQL